MKKYLLFNRVVPRWVIMVLDIFIVATSFSFSYFIVYRFEFTNILRGYFFIYTGLYCIITAEVMYIMRIHTGLIRYSNTRDVLRIFSSVFISTIIYFAITDIWVLPTWPIGSVTVDTMMVVNFSISSTLLILLRTAVKSAYYYINNY
jgi:FlaA1/EpsC-like NDP-sugar epimerase